MMEMQETTEEMRRVLDALEIEVLMYVNLLVCIFVYLRIQMYIGIRG
jgi:hypothetical protein